MELGVLGPLELRSHGERVALGGPKQRLVLGLLVARRGGVVGLDELIDALWPDGPHARPRKTVQVYVTRLRRALAGSADAIRGDGGGYRFDPTVVAVDADAFEDDVRRALVDADDERAASRLRAGLARWRGHAFADLRGCLDLLPSAVQLDERRLVAQHELFERMLRTDPRAVVGELERAVEANALHEGFAAQLMTAQYRVGRQADALATYRSLRRRLADELGLEPAPALRELEGRILRHELPSFAPPGGEEPVVDRQRRRVTIVSVEVAVDGPFPIDPEIELALTTPVRRAVRVCLVERDGVMVAEGADAVTACFGFPAAERAPERAVLAALAAAQHSDERVAVRVGLDTGVVVLEGAGHGALGGIAGEPVRRAVRWRDLAAPGEVVLGPSTVALVDDVVEVRDLDGRAIAVAARDTAPTDADGSGLVGRSQLLAELDRLVVHASDHLVCVAISGPPGIGKTALVEHFLRDRAGRAVWLRCDRRRQATPLQPVRDVLPELFAGGGEPTNRALVAALSALCGGDPVIVVDDLDAADPSTLDLLELLPTQLAAGLVLLTTRSPAPVELAGDLVAHVAVGPLDRGSSRTLAAAAGGRRLRLDTLNEVADRAAGVPLHVRTLAAAIAHHDGPTTAVPTSLYGSLISSLDRLGPARRVARRLAVLGPSFDADEIGDVLGADRSAYATDLDALLTAGVLQREGSRFRFTSELVAETAHESMLLAERTALHAAVADALTARGARPEQLAFHLEAASRPFEAAVAWRRASADAIRQARHREAANHARRALRLLDGIAAPADGGETRRRALTALAVGLQARTHGGDELLAVVAEARRAGVGADDLGRRMVLDIMEVSALHERGEYVRATAVADQLVRDTTAAGDELSRAFALQFLGACHVWRGDLRVGRQHLEHAAAAFEALGGSGPMGAHAEGAMWTLLALAATFEDRPDDAERLQRRARSVIPADDGYTRCLVAATSAMADQLLGNPVSVRAAVEPVWQLAMDLGSDFWFGWAQALLGWAIAADDLPAGIAMLTEAVDDHDTRQVRPYFLALLGDRLCEHGQLNAGLARLEEGIELVEQTDERLWEPLLRLTRARWLAAAGEPSGADAVTAALALAAERGQQLLLRRHDDGLARDRRRGAGARSPSLPVAHPEDLPR